MPRRKRPKNVRAREKPSAPMQSPINGGGEVVLYEAPDGQIRLDVRLDHETVWLTQAQMVELFQRNHSVISRHVRNVFANGELPVESNMQKMHIAFSDRPIVLYSPIRSHAGACGNLNLSQSCRQRSAHMIVVSNRLQVAKGHEADFEKRFEGRARLVENMPGFIRLEILRPVKSDYYIVLTHWGRRVFPSLDQQR